MGMTSIQRELVFHNIDDAAVFLNQIEPDTTQWWQGVELKKAKEKFLHAFAKTDTNWAKAWHKTVTEIINP